MVIFSMVSPPVGARGRLVASCDLRLAENCWTACFSPGDVRRNLLY